MGARKSLASLIPAAVFLFSPAASKALQVVWDVDPANSYVRLTVPDQVVNVTNIGNITVRMRDAGNDSSWSDAGGRRAFLEGTILTEYTDATSISFTSGGHNLYALEQTSLRPDPAQWDPVTLTYTNTGAALAGLGARVRGTYMVIFTFDAAFLALRNVHFDIASTALPVVSGSFAGGQTRFGIPSANADVDGLELPLSLGQPVPDTLHGQLPTTLETNTAAGVIENLGGSYRKLTYPVSIPSLSIQVGGVTLAGSAGGQIVAYATLPVTRPTLRIQRQGGNVVLAWPSSTTGFVLEQNPALNSGFWATVTNAPVVVGSEQQVTLATSADKAFYRLRSQ